MTEAYLLSRQQPLHTPFEFAFGTNVGFFRWLEGEEEGVDENPSQAMGKGTRSRHGFV